MAEKQSYQDRFIEALFHFMADHGLTDRKELPKYFDISYMTLLKIIDQSQKATIPQCIELCLKAGISANWLFLGIGDMNLQRQISLNEIYQQVREMPPHRIVHKGKKK